MVLRLQNSDDILDGEEVDLGGNAEEEVAKGRREVGEEAGGRRRCGLVPGEGAKGGEGGKEGKTLRRSVDGAVNE